MIYFDNEKRAYAYPIPDYICFIEDEIWSKYAGTDKWDIVDGEFVDVTETEEYQQKHTDLREADFKSKFFNIDGYGWYRKQPKGYQSAVESMNVLFNIANVSNGVQAGLIIFYQAPNFTKPEECTEEWLISHQIIQGAMTKEEFMILYVAFMTSWNRAEHEQRTLN